MGGGDSWRIVRADVSRALRPFEAEPIEAGTIALSDDTGGRHVEERTERKHRTLRCFLLVISGVSLLFLRGALLRCSGAGSAGQHNPSGICRHRASLRYFCG